MVHIPKLYHGRMVLHMLSYAIYFIEIPISDNAKQYPRTLISANNKIVARFTRINIFAKTGSSIKLVACCWQLPIPVGTSTTIAASTLGTRTGTTSRSWLLGTGTSKCFPVQRSDIRKAPSITKLVPWYSGSTLNYFAQFIYQLPVQVHRYHVHVA